MNNEKLSKNVRTVLEILKNEIDGDIKSALQKMTRDYTMTWVYQTKKELFPTEKISKKAEFEEVYQIKGRQYDIKNITESKNVVMVECVESYPDPKTKKVYRTPLILVLEMQNGKIRTGRHYCDPNLSYLFLDKTKIKRAYKKPANPSFILK